MLSHLLTLILGLISGYLIHVSTMKVSFKQRTLENKIKVYDSIIIHWVKARNFLISALPDNPWDNPTFDQLYGESQSLIGEAVLVSEDMELTKEINLLNERLFKSPWVGLNNEEKINSHIEKIKDDALRLIERMRNDIKESSSLSFGDLKHIFSGIFKNK